MLAYQSRPPDPALLGERSRDIWLERLEGKPFMLENWLAHQRRDAFWRHGSICEDFAAVAIPPLVLAGRAAGSRHTPLEVVADPGAGHQPTLGPLGPNSPPLPRP